MLAFFTFRRATLDDLSRLVPLFDAYRQFYEQAPDLIGAERFLRERLEKNESVIFLALDEHSRGAGFVQLYPVFSSVRMKRFWLLNDLFTAPEFRGQGIGEQLIEKAKQLASETNAKGLLLQTAVTNKAGQRLYERTGFVRDEDSYYYEWRNKL